MYDLQKLICDYFVQKETYKFNHMYVVIGLESYISARDYAVPLAKYAYFC